MLGTRDRKFRRSATFLRVGTLLLSGGSTVILGLQDLDLWASVGFTLVALVTVVSSLESFFNWRSRWVLMEERLARFHRLRERLALQLGRTDPASLSYDDVASFFKDYSGIWESTSEQWLQQRRAGTIG